MQLIDYRNDTLFYRADLSKSLKTATVRSQLPGAMQVRRPENDAVMFYYCMSILNDMETHKGLDTDLTQEEQIIVDNIMGILTTISFSLFSYLIVICWGEMRYASGHGVLAQMDGETLYVCKACGVSSGKSGFKDGIMSLGYDNFFPIAQALKDGFNTKGWGGAYGGKKWGEVANIVTSYLKGDIPLVILCDQAFNAEHNCGTIFNKSYLYKSAGSDMKKVLDVQKSGQIPEMVYAFLSNNQHYSIVKGAVDGGPEQAMFKDILLRVYNDPVSLIGKEINDWVDWYKVKALSGAGFKDEMKKQTAESEYKDGAEAMKPKEKKDPPGFFTIKSLGLTAKKEKRK